MDDRRISTLVAAVIVFVVLGILFDVTRRSMRRPAAAEAPVPALAPADSPPARPPAAADTVVAPARPPGESLPGASRGADPAAAASSYMELVARAETRRQIRASAGVTYLSEIVAASGDSMLHRWDNRVTRPVRVHLAPGRAANFQPAFLDAVRAALRTWESAVPVRFAETADSSAAEVHVFWKVQFDIERTGQTDLVWNADGHIERGVITLATFDPDGRPMGVEEIRVVALHEIGHLIGLDHSPDSGDVMYPVARARQLSRRDIETARLLYQLAPGSLR